MLISPGRLADAFLVEGQLASDCAIELLSIELLSIELDLTGQET